MDVLFNLGIVVYGLTSINVLNFETCSVWTGRNCFKKRVEVVYRYVSCI